MYQHPTHSIGYLLILTHKQWNHIVIVTNTLKCNWRYMWKVGINLERDRLAKVLKEFQGHCQ